MATYKYATYPDAKVFNKSGKQIQHLLWGDWVKIMDEPSHGGKIKVHTRGVNGYMLESDLQDEALLDIVFVDVGQGDGCLVVTPDDQRIIIDAGVKDNMYRYLKWRFNFRGGPRRFDAAIITHPDKDHYYGFKYLFEEQSVHIHRLYHNGIQEIKGKKPLGAMSKFGKFRYLTHLIPNTEDAQTYVQDPSAKGKEYAGVIEDGLGSLIAEGKCEMLSTTETSKDFVPGFDENKPCSIEILGPIVEERDGKPALQCFGDKPGSTAFNSGKTKNGHSVILKLKYRDITIMLGGDLNSPAEAFLMEKYTGLSWPPEDSNAEETLIAASNKVFGADISKCCHHGSSDFTDAFMASVNPVATVVSSGDEESHAHPRCDTLGAIGRHGRGWRPLIFSTELARSTRENENKTRDALIKVEKRLAKPNLTASKRKKYEAEKEDLIEDLKLRNVTTYGAITLRSDGHKVVMAYKREKPARYGSSLKKWDIYQMEKVGNGPLTNKR